MGIFVDENSSNVYKIYRATRVGPDSTIDPARQLAFYDPGIGSPADSREIKIRFLRKFYNMICQGTGLGITKNIIVRCVGGVLSHCGVPAHMNDGSPLRYDPVTIRAIATEAVKEVCQHGASIRGDPFKELRVQRAQTFRRDYGSDRDGHANEYPYFIGVFDTVAALGVSPPICWALGTIGTVLTALIAAGLAWLLSLWMLSFWP